jgi:hypothetical protein
MEQKQEQLFASIILNKKYVCVKKSSFDVAV